MRLSLHAQGTVIVTKATDRSVSINNIDYDKNILITNSEVTTLDATRLSNLTTNILSEIINQTKPQLFIFATNETIMQIPKEIIKLLMEKQIGFEVMKTPAAMRTFNFLVGEDRLVSCLIFIEV